MHLLIPFANSTSQGCHAALQGLKLPYLDKLLRKLPLAQTDAAEVTAFSPPHERALAAVHGISAADGQIPFGAWHAAQAGHTVAPGQAWALITPCHWAVQSQHITMLNPQALNLQEEESRALLAAMLPFFVQDGIDLVYDTPIRWLARGEQFAGLSSASFDRVIGSGEGKSVDQWLPRADAAKSLRRLQQEMQMLLYTHALTDARNARGEVAVNSFWVSGTGAMTAAMLATPESTKVKPINTLRDAALNADWAAWAQAWQQIDTTECAALLAASQKGAKVTLTLCGERAARVYGNLSADGSAFGSAGIEPGKNSTKTDFSSVLGRFMNAFSSLPANNILAML